MSTFTDQPDSEQEVSDFVKRIGAEQELVCQHLSGKVNRGQHQKQILGGFGTFRVSTAIPESFRHGPFSKPGKEYRVAFRFSNGQPCAFADSAKDVRGLAIKFFDHNDVETDLLATNEGGRSHARNASQFMSIADALVRQIVNGPLAFAWSLLRSVFSGSIGPFEAARCLWILLTETSRKVKSVATEEYWGSVVQLGGTAIKYGFVPQPSSFPGTLADPNEQNYLRLDLQRRLTSGPVSFRVSLKSFFDERVTPVNDASIAWSVDAVHIGTFEVVSLPSPEEENVVNSLAFNPANGFSPLGITHARKAVYAASAANREATPTASVKHYFE